MKELFDLVPSWMWFLFGLTGGYLICLADVTWQASKEEYVVVIKNRRR
jgi:hypothetical protein